MMYEVLKIEEEFLTIIQHLASEESPQVHQS